MFILYIDGSGAVQNPDETHFVLAGVAVWERQIFHLIQALDSLVDSFNLGPADQIEIHGNPMYSGRKEPWRSVPRKDRVSMMLQVLDQLVKASKGVQAFGVAVNKEAKSPDDPVEYAFEEISNRFNLFLSRNYKDRGGRDQDKQKGLIVMDESHYEQPLQALARDFRINGTRWGHLRNLAEVPLFVDSRASRIIQLADLVAYAMWRQYEHDDGRFFKPIVQRFDRSGGIFHGLVHHKLSNENCYCPACMSRQGQRSPAAGSIAT